MSFKVGDTVRRTGVLNYMDRVPEGTLGVVTELISRGRWPYKVKWELLEYDRRMWVDDNDIEKVVTPSSFNDAFGEYYVTAKGQQTVPGTSTRWAEQEDIPVDTASTVDMVNHPPHYTRGGIEVLDFIMAYFADDYLLGQVVKYTARSGHKWDTLEDLEKAAFYLNRKIEEVKKGNQND